MQYVKKDLKQIEIESLLVEQRTWLFRCLKRNSSSYYGRHFNFESIDSVGCYQERVPLIGYENIAHLIQRIADGENDVLFKGGATAFEVTGGSTSGGKLIPYTKESFSDFQRAILPWFNRVVQRYGITGEKAYWSISPALHRLKTTKGGVTIGVDDRAYLGEEVSTFADSTVVPSWVGDLNDVRQWQIVTLYWLIRSCHLEFISIWSPTFLLMLLNILNDRYDEVMNLLSEGGELKERSLGPDHNACDRLRRYSSNNDCEQLWPQLKLISCWQDASSKPFAKLVQKRFPNTAFQAKGLICTEGIVTIPDNEGNPLLSADSGFYEFLDKKKNVYLPHELTTGDVYEVVMTTSGGLYRYQTNDLVRYEGLKMGLPILRFIGRSGIVSDMVGEKLNEAFVQQVLDDIDDFTMLVATNTKLPHYILLGDSVNVNKEATRVEKELRQNPQYAYARNIGQLGRLKMVVLRDAMQLYIDYRTALGSRVGDIKIPALQTDEAWLQIIQRKSK